MMELVRVVRPCFTVLQIFAVCFSVLLCHVRTDTCSNEIFLEFYLQQCLVSHHDREIHHDSTLAFSLDQWQFAPQQILYEIFPIDPMKAKHVRLVKNALFSIVYPVPFKTTTLLVAVSNTTLIDILDMDPQITESQSFIDFVSGAYLKPGPFPLSHRYGGHQFGMWAGQLGDGRAVMLGEYENRKGERWELQLKGSGLTPYSRRGDGRAVLRSSVREFLCSEAMHFLGIPTSRAAALVVSNDAVIRDQFYTGHPQSERGAVVLRLAHSWFRIGSLEILADNDEIKLLKDVVDFITKSYFPSIADDTKKYLAFYSEVVSATAKLIAKWQSVGFAHGVCNTDNFSLLSITIDYGPFGFLDEYDPGFIPNTSDDEGMYSYERQPDVGAFNLNKLRLALLPLLADEDKPHAISIHRGYADIYKSEFMNLFRKKIGLVNSEEDDEELVALLLKMMEDTQADFTMTFRQLGEIPMRDLEQELIQDKLWAVKDLRQHQWFGHWVQLYVERVTSSGIAEDERRTLMNNVNPKYILRNWIAQQAISLADRNDFKEVRRVLRVLQNPFTEQKEAEEKGYSSRPPSWADSLKVSCSS